MNSKDKVRNGIIRAQGSNNSAVLFVAGDNKMKDHANRTNIFGRARMLFMALLMVLTMTATAMSGTDAYAANDTVYVATYDQLRVALEDTPGVKEVVVDPQAAVEEGEVVYGVEEDENSDAFYIGFDGPLTVSHDITITSADDVDVYFARSDSFRRDQGKPALLNIDSTGNLNLDGLITMTGEEVATTFYEADEENPAEFFFSVKSKDGTGEDNEVWNRGQALKGGFYIQNNGGEYTLGDDVIMEDINLADDVEGVEQIHEVEKTTLRSLYSSNKGDEEVVEEEAVEEKAAEEEATQKEEVVVAPAPKKSLKSLMSAPALKLGGSTGGKTYEVDSWLKLQHAIKAANSSGDTIIITKDIVAKKNEFIDSAAMNNGSLLLRGKTLTIKGPADREVHIYRDKNDADFPIFEVRNDNNKLTLGKNLVLSGKALNCSSDVSAYTVRFVNQDNSEWQASPNKYSVDGSGNIDRLIEHNGAPRNDDANGPNTDGTRKMTPPARPGQYFNGWLLPDGSTTGTAKLPRTSDEIGAASVIPANKITGSMTVAETWYEPKSAVTKASDVTVESQVLKYNGKTVTYNGNSITPGFYRNNNPSDWGCPGYIPNKDNIKDGIGYVSLKAGNKFVSNIAPHYSDDVNVNNSTGLARTQWYIKDNIIVNGANEWTFLYIDPSTGVASIRDLRETAFSDKYQGIASYNPLEDTVTQKCDGTGQPEDVVHTSSTFTGGGNIGESKAFFVNVHTRGELNIDGATFEDFKTDGTVKHAAPIVVSSEATLNMSSGEIRNNIVGYGAKEAEDRPNNDSQSTVQRLGELIRDTQPTNTAGGVIFTGTGTTGTFKGSAKISDNRADAGALIITDGASVTMKESSKDKDEKYELEFKKNVGWHHSGAVLVEDGGTFTMDDGSINNNVAWWKGGAVWATEFGTNGLVQWQKYPTVMKDSVTRHTDAEGKPRGGNFIMNGGELDSNFANARAGAVEVESDGVQLLGGTISKNKCKSLGGGIYVEGDSPIYSYTLTIRNGYIGDNTSVAAVKNGDLDKKIVNGQLLPGDDYDSHGGYHKDKDWAAWGKQHTGDGGGVWLCAMGGTSIFTSNGNDNVIIDNNHAARVSGDNNGYGDDFYISHRHGSALVQNMLGTWKKDGDNDLPIDPQVGGTLRGPLGMENKGNPETGKDYKESDVSGIKIVDNMARNGGGLAVNGTVIMGTPADVYRYQSEFDFEKKWETGLNERAVTIGLYYEFDTNNDGTIDPDTEVFPLNQEGTDTQYTVEFGTNEDVVSKPTGNELIYKYGNNKAKASVPIKIKHAGEDFYLYRVYNVQDEGEILTNSNEEFIDLENQEHLKELFEYINNRVELKLRVKWNILVKEEESNEFIMTSKDVTAKASTTAGEEISLIDPDKKEELDKFTVFFDKIEFGQELQNNPKPWFIKGDYLDDSTRITDAEFKLYHAIEDDSTTTSGARVYKADFSEGKGEVVDGVHYSETDNRYYLDITPPETGTDLYLLFETKAHDGYILPKAPWGIKYHADGTYEAFRFNDTAAAAFEAKYKNINILTQEELSKLEILCTEINVPIGADHKINNDKNEPIKLTKVRGTSATNLSTDVKIPGAKFRLYTTTENPNGTWHKGTEVEPRQELVSDGNGDITLPRAVTRTAGSDIVYWLEETQAAPGYVKNSAPWLIWVTNGNVTHLRYATPSRFDGTKVVRGDDLGGYIDLTNLKYIHNEPLEFKKVSSANTDLTLKGATLKIAEIGNSDKAQKLTQLSNAWFKDTPDVVSCHLQDGTVFDTQTTNVDGKFKFNINKAGVYLIYEETAPTGYKKAINPWILVIKENGDHVLMHNTTTNARVNTDYWDTSAYTKCNGLVLENERKPIELTKVDENGTAVTGSSAQFVITVVGEDDPTGWYILEGRNRPKSTLTSASAAKFGGTAKTVSSDAQTGKININDLPQGKYLLFETSAPKGFRRATSPWLIEVTDNENGRSWNIFALKSEYVDKALMWGTGTTPTEQTIAENDQSAYKRWWPDNWFDKHSVENIANERKYITKVDKDNTTTVLNGAEFTLYYAYRETASNIPAGEEWIRQTKDVAVQTLKSDAKGRIELPSSITRTATVETNDPDYPGKRHGYLLVETKAPNGYKKSSTPWWITVDSNGNVTVKATTHARRSTLHNYDWWWVSDFTDANGLVKNTPNETVLTKVNGFNHNETLAGAVFEIYHAQVRQVASTSNPGYNYDYEYKKGDYISTTTATGTDGRIVLPVLPDGDYILEEITAPDGFEKSKTPWVITYTTYEYGRTTTHTVKSYDTVVISGKDGWYDAQGMSCQGGGSLENFPSVNLKKVDVESVEITEGEDGEEIITTGDTNPTFLSGVKFKLYEADVNGGNWSKKSDIAVHVSDTNSEGIVVTNDNGVLELGTLKKEAYYLLYEHEAKTGYILPSAPWRIKIGSDGKIENLWVPADENGTEYKDTDHKTYLTNTRIYNLPSAGGMGTYWFMIIGAMMMGFALTAGFTKMNLLKLLRR